MPAYPRRSASAGILVVVAFIAACGPTFGPPAPSGPGGTGPPPLPSPGGTLYGRVLRADGRAASLATVNLVQVRPADALFAVFSPGFGCLIPNACANRPSARVSSEGAFVFPEKAVEPGLRSVVTAVLSPLDDREWTGPQTSAGLADGPDPQEVPDLVAWEPRLFFSAGGAEVRVRWPSLSVGLKRPGVRYTLEAVLGETGSPLVRLAGPQESTEALFDSRVFEDTDYQLVVVAETTVAVDGQEVAFAYRSGSQAVPVKAGAAPSRGRPCLTDDPTATLRPVGPCPLTDGDLQLHQQVSNPACPTKGPECVQTHQRLCVDIGPSRPVSLVVYRTPFLYDQALVELSADGKRFVSAGRPIKRGSGNTEVFSVPVDPPQPATIACIRGPFSGAALREISVW